jgi:hypothetical protein
MSDKILRLVVFSILMENNQGIVRKDPNYIWEKFTSAMERENPESLLDRENTAKLKEWLKIWRGR